jgi:serine protease AprX
MGRQHAKIVRNSTESCLIQKGKKLMSGGPDSLRLLPREPAIARRIGNSAWQGANMESTRVIVECRTHRTGSSDGKWLKFLPMKVDASYLPLPIQPQSPELQRSLDVEGDVLFLVRGAVRPTQLEVLREHRGVVDVFFDNAVAPFYGRDGVVQPEDWLMDVRPGPITACAIPPCDGTPSQPHGCLLDVASYIGAEQLWQNAVNGEGITIGIVDGGITAESRIDPNRPGLVPRVTDGWPKANWGTIAGWRGHGNMVAIDALGMAPRASLYDIRISDGHPSSATMSDAIAGIQWAIEKYRATGTPHILCCGWGIYASSHDYRYAQDVEHPLTRKISEAMDEGIIVLFAAGNGGLSSPSTRCCDDVGPGNSIWGVNGHPRVMTVGAVNRDEELIGYSSQGPAALDEGKPDFCGVSHFAGYFSSDSGTSAACAIVSGVVALLKQVRPTLTQEAIKRLLKSTAKDLGPPGWDRHSGSGVIQAHAAYIQLKDHRPQIQVDHDRVKQLEAENQCLRDLFIDLAMERQLRREASSKSTSANGTSTD